MYLQNIKYANFYGNNVVVKPNNTFLINSNKNQPTI